MALKTLILSALLIGANAVHSAVKGTGSTTRGWSCCKNSCSWNNKAAVSKPVLSCDAQDNPLTNPARRDGCESGGGAFACSDLSPWAASNDLAYGWAGVNLAASNESSWCCSCYALTFTSGPVNGKKMIVQVTNTGNDLGDDQFDLAIPGGGQGATRGCSKEFGTDNGIWGPDYGGVAHRDECDVLPEPLKGGCYWRFDWFRNADNPSVTWEKVVCPEALSYVSGCRRNDDPVPGKNTPTPTATTSAPIASGTVVQGGQCGGKTYKGPTVCVGGTVCTFVDENSYYCLPDPASTRTTPTTTSAPTAKPTIGLPWDQCGGNGWTGPTKCKDSVCISFDEWYSQCQPLSTSAVPTTTTTTSRGGRPRPTWSFTRPPITFPGTTTTRQPTNPTPTGYAQLYEQCGGKTWTGITRCAPGLQCVADNEYFSMCQKQTKKRSAKFLH